VSDWRLHIDVTAILIAAHIGILDYVEKAFKPLRLPSHLRARLKTPVCCDHYWER
jgi:hypothetical protein